MILSVSRRTDIPCYYSEWFINRLKEGYVLTRNPINHSQVSRISLSPDVVDCIVFWTKDAKNIIPHLKLIDNMGYKYYFQFTLTPYDCTIEKNMRDKNDIVSTFIELSSLVGKERVLWRYDPIILNDRLTVDYHLGQFLQLCDRLRSYTESVTISFVDYYKKLRTDVIRDITDMEIAELAVFIGQTAKSYDLDVKACCEKMDLTVYGIGKASCIDKDIIEKVCGHKLDVKQDKNQREYCGCVESIDIGTYNTCANGCVYCYANFSEKSVESNMKAYNPKSEILNDILKSEERVTERKVKSLKKVQIELF
ncbi:MAG: DUF1848 domain-containing protein [Clostridia bacterium]|nr:DUF1848 domain-containing protein [Clostridia bacterium]